MIYGRVDEMRNGKVFGWAFDSEQPDEHLKITVRRGAQTVAEDSAKVFREDLPAAGIGKGDHAFEIMLPPHITSLHGLVFTASSDAAGETVLAIASNDERHLDDLFQVFSGRYDGALRKLKEEVAALAQAGSAAQRIAEVEERILQLERRIDATDVFIMRLDETSRRVQERVGLLKPRGFFSRLFFR